MSNILRPSSRSATPSTRPTPRATQIKSENSASGTPGTPSSTGSAAQKYKYTDYRLRSYSPDEKVDKRFHVMKFYSRQNVDPTEFQQPVTMHRKDPRVLRYQAQQKEAEPNGDVKKEEESIDKMEGVKSELDKVAPEPEASVAPDGQRRSKKHGFQKKTRQVYAGDVNERKLRYEEYYPWLVEDFDGKNTWVGNYEAAQSDCYVLFVFDEDGFKMVPAEKWYKFTPRNKYATLSLDEAEAMMAKKSQPPRWLMKHLHPENEDDQVVVQPTRKRLRTVDSQQRAVRKREDDDADELDFDEEFADDEEAPIMEGPEDESKEVEQRVKRQMMVKEEDLGDENALADRDRKIGEEGRKLKQSLRALEKNAIYDTDDEEEEDPFSTNALF
ncbi:hypothetical protein V1517DRAFT_310164 [Lipomyces orientalis]|uniref:Uncharacterized protein n=1 Tax=Lipomyces orientalis TaxID=1233043 RepID=A0ACC3TG39_9ASCO